MIDGRPQVLQHPSQAAVLLGYEPPPSLRDAVAVAWDIDTIAQAWIELAMTTPWDALCEPARGFGRTPLALTVDALVGIAALTAALDTGWFHWPGNPVSGELGDEILVAYERSIVDTIASREDLLAFARPAAAAWRDAIAAHADELGREPERPMHAPRGDLPLVELLEAQRLHAAQHYRQATTFVGRKHRVPELDLADLTGLELPEAIY